MMALSNRSTLKQTLASTHFDAVVIGGGISGAWIACQLSEQGYSVAILERNDFASETSSASSKLLHGGIRYLQQLQFGKVRESSLERAQYLSAAPHLAQAVPFLVPTYSDLKRSKTVLHCGMLAYQTLGIGQGAKLSQAGVSLPRTSSLSKDELLQACRIAPDKLTGAVCFPEFHLYDSERCVWSIIETAIATGAVAANYTVADALVANGRTVTGVRARMQSDNEQIVINASLVINAAGPWVDEVTQSLEYTSSVTSESNVSDESSMSDGRVNNDEISSPSTINHATSPKTIQNYATGAHLITRQLVADYAVAITTQQQSNATIGRGGRHIFIIPWRGLSLIGTSYRETQDPNDASLLLQEDIDQLLESVNAALPDANLQPKDVISAYSGLYPLRVERTDSKVYSGSGEYLIIDHTDADQLDGLVTALGAKFTTGRILAQKTTELCAHKLRLAIKDTPAATTVGAGNTLTQNATKHKPEMHKTGKRLSNANYDKYDEFLAATQESLGERFSESQIIHLVRCYGSQVSEFITMLDSDTIENKELLCQSIVETQPDILGQVAWAVDHEMAIHLDDVLLRRTSIGLLGIDQEGIGKVADIMAKRLGWSAQKIQSEVQVAIERQENIRSAVSHYYQHPENGQHTDAPLPISA